MERTTQHGAHNASTECTQMSKPPFPTAQARPDVELTAPLQSRVAR